MVLRNLTQEEITRLPSTRLSSTDWQRVKLLPDLKPIIYKMSVFSGDIELGIFDYEFILEGRTPQTCRFVQCHLTHNCRVGNNVLIENIPNYIANYRIGEIVLYRMPI